MKATEQYFPVVLFIMLYKVILTFESVDEIQKLFFGLAHLGVNRLKSYKGSFRAYPVNSRDSTGENYYLLQ